MNNCNLKHFKYILFSNSSPATLTSGILPDESGKVTTPEISEIPGSRVDARGQFLGIDPSSITTEDKWTIGSFVSLGGSVDKSANITNLTEQ